VDEIVILSLAVCVSVISAVAFVVGSTGVAGGMVFLFFGAETSAVLFFVFFGAVVFVVVQVSGAIVFFFFGADGVDDGVVSGGAEVVMDGSAATFFFGAVGAASATRCSWLNLWGSSGTLNTSVEVDAAGDSSCDAGGFFRFLGRGLDGIGAGSGGAESASGTFGVGVTWDSEGEVSVEVFGAGATAAAVWFGAVPRSF
jgi:hypothetical protein